MVSNFGRSLLTSTCWAIVGVVTEIGTVLCDCMKCNGAAITFSEFEIHAGSNNRRPGECIYLTQCSASLKVLLSLFLGGHHWPLSYPPADAPISTIRIRQCKLHANMFFDQHSSSYFARNEVLSLLGQLLPV